jgi:hypothetical protein
LRSQTKIRRKNRKKQDHDRKEPTFLYPLPLTPEPEPKPENKPGRLRRLRGREIIVKKQRERKTKKEWFVLCFSQILVLLQPSPLL